MGKKYDGLVAYKIEVNGSDIITASPNCQAMIQLKMVDGVCVSPYDQQQIEYVGDQG